MSNRTNFIKRVYFVYENLIDLIYFQAMIEEEIPLVIIKTIIEQI